MANIDGIGSYNRSASAINVLLAAYGNDIVDVSAGTGYGLNLTAGSLAEFENFLDRVFLQNYVDLPLTFNGTVWTQEFVGKTLRGRYLQKNKSKLFLANCQFTDPQTPLDVISVGS